MLAAGGSTATISKSTETTDNGLRSFPGVDLIKAGTWDAHTGTATITRADLAAAVAAAAHLPDPIIKIGHDDPRFTGSPALGRVTNLRLADRGETLVGDLVDMPAWLADSAATAFPQRSIEGITDFSSNGLQFRFVLTGLALLGASWPAVTDLDSLKDLLERSV